MDDFDGHYDDNDLAQQIKELQEQVQAAKLTEAGLAEQLRHAAEQRARHEKKVARIAEAARLRAEAEKAARLKAEAEKAARLKAEAEEAARLKAEAEEAARLEAEEAARLAEEEETRLAEEEAARARHAAMEKSKQEKAAHRRAEEEKVRFATEQELNVLKEKSQLAAKPKPRTPATRKEPRPAHSSNRNLQAGVATSSVKGTRMHTFDSKGAKANDESGHWSEEGLSDDVIMLDAETTVSTSLLAFTRKLKTILAREKGQGTPETPP
jgi:membrane protein involved in colicin uptake